MLSKILCLDISTQLKLVEISEFDDLGIRIEEGGLIYGRYKI